MVAVLQQQVHPFTFLNGNSMKSGILLAARSPRSRKDSGGCLTEHDIFAFLYASSMFSLCPTLTFTMATTPSVTRPTLILNCPGHVALATFRLQHFGGSLREIGICLNRGARTSFHRSRGIRQPTKCTNSTLRNIFWIPDLTKTWLRFKPTGLNSGGHCIPDSRESFLLGLIFMGKN